MTFGEFIVMPESYQYKWISEHFPDKVLAMFEYKALYDEWLEQQKTHDSIDHNVKRFRERRKMREISRAVMDGKYSGYTSDGQPWRIDFSDSHVDSWRDQYFNSECEDMIKEDE